MAVANLKKIDSKLKDLYKDQVTNAVPAAPQEPFVDKSDLLFMQMNFIAAYNKQMLAILKELGLTTSNVKKLDDDDEL